MNSNLKNFFYPSSICIAGASAKEKSIGFEILKSIKNFGYAGKIYPVNPKADEILGYKCFHSVDEIDEAIDLAVIVTPKQFVIETVEELIGKNVKSIILITAGFREAGAEGKKLEEELFSKLENSNTRLVGPNCMGVINTLPEVKLNATFVAEKPLTGSLAFLSQSGALGAAVLNSLRETHIKFSHFISVGNKTDLNENDFISFWQEDNNIGVITLYLESFSSGFEFIKMFMLNKISKPVILIKAGRTEGGIKAASSHTGALSSSDKIADAVLKQFGVVRTYSLRELFNTAKGFEFFPMPNGKKIAVVTNAGGPAVLAVDIIEEEGLTLAEFDEETKAKLRTIVHPEGSIENPIDLLPGATGVIFENVVRIAAEDKNVDAVISLFVEPVMVRPKDVVEAVNSINSTKPIFQVVMPLPEFWSRYDSAAKPLFKNPEDPAKVINNMIFQQLSSKKNILQKEFYSALMKKYNRNIIEGKPGFLSHELTNGLIAKYDLSPCKNIIINPQFIKNFEIDFYPAALKAVAPELVHKSDFNAVLLNINNRKELLRKTKELEKNLKMKGIVEFDYLIQPFIKAKHELLIGGFRDKSFGPIIMFGSGGKYVEVFDDTAIRSAFAGDEEIFDMIYSTKIGIILSGTRGEKPVELGGIVSTIKKAALMLIENENITEFDFNPAIIDIDDNIHLVDVRIKIV